MPLPLQLLLGLWMAGVTVAAFTYVPPARGFADNEAARIVVFHVPCAMIAVLAYLVSMGYAAAYLARRGAGLDLRSAISAGLGLLFTVLATATGMVFARVQWGTAWNWDPKEFAIFLLMIVYASYFALRGAIPAAVTRARVSAVYNILAGVVMPYLVIILPRMVGGLHPVNASLDAPYRIVMFAAAAGMALLYVWLMRIHVRLAERALAQRRKA